MRITTGVVAVVEMKPTPGKKRDNKVTTRCTIQYIRLITRPPPTTHSLGLISEVIFSTMDKVQTPSNASSHGNISSRSFHSHGRVCTHAHLALEKFGSEVRPAGGVLPLGPHSRFGDKLLGIIIKVSPKRECGAKGVNGRSLLLL